LKKDEMLTKKATIKENRKDEIVDESQTQSEDIQDKLRDKEFGGRKGLEPTRYGDWEKNGRCIDF
jgi:hypothetical protein